MEASELFRSQFGLTEEPLLQRLTELSEIRQLRKGRDLYREGEQPTSVSFLLQGLLRGYFLDAGGRDITDCFAFEPGAPANASIVLGERAVVNVQALENSQVLELPVDPILRLMEEWPQLCRLYSTFLHKALKSHWEVKAAMYQYDAMERYQWFLEAYPGLYRRVSGKHIASFLGMTQVTLSRLRRTIREREQLQVAQSEG